MAQQRDYYSILQVNRGASQEAIKASYLRLAELYAPASRKKSRARAAARMREIEAAFSVLSDKTKRARYDRRLAKGRHPSQSGASNGEPLWLSGAVPAFLSRPSSLVALPSAGLAVFIIVTVLLSVLGGNGGETAASSQPSPPGSTGLAEPGNTASAASPKVSDESGDEAPEGFTRFTSDVKGYSIVYPDGWGTEEGDYGAEVFWEFDPAGLNNNVSVLCEEIDPGLAGEYVDRNVELLKSQARDVQIMDDDLQIGGSSGGALLHWSTSIGVEEIEISQAAVGIDGWAGYSP